MIENSSSGLALLDPDHEVVVTGEEDHQDALAAWAPTSRPRRVAAELRFAPLRRGAHAGERGVEVLLDGRRVGELTHLMSVRYGPYVDAEVRRGHRPGAVALVKRGRRGLMEMELRLPDTAAAAPAPLPAPLPPGPGPRRPVPFGDDEPARGGRRKTPYLIGAGVLGLLLVIGATVGGRDEPAPPPLAAPPTSAPVTTTSVAPTTAAPTTTPDPVPAAAAAAPRTSTRTATPRPTTPAAPTTTPPAAAPLPIAAAAPEPEPTREPDPPAEASYENCAAVRAAGADPIRRGDPGYARHLDRDGDGVGCE